jgi:ATP-dependent DNA helicase Q4
MGLDKQDLGAVLHTSMPHSLEEYVQQVGRGGRDGRTATCVLFLDAADYIKLRVLAHGRVARRASIEAFLQRVFGREEEEEEAGAAGGGGSQAGSSRAGSSSRAAASGKPAKQQPKLAPSQHR